VRIEHPGLGAELAQQALGFQRQLAAIRLRPQRSVQDQDPRRMRGTGHAQMLVAWRFHGGGEDVG